MMDRRRNAVVTLIVVLAATWSGCMGEGGQAADAPAGFDEEGIVMRVTVIDEEFYPIDGAVVQIDDAGVMATTDANGTAFIRDVEAGAYRVVIQAIGFVSVAHTVEIPHRGVAELRIVLTAAPIIEPYDTLEIVEGLSGCNVVLILGWFDFGEFCAAAGIEKNEILPLSYADDWTASILELDWDQGGMFVFEVDEVCDGPCVRDRLHAYTAGGSPLRISAHVGQVADGHDPDKYDPFPDGAGDLTIYAVWAGYFGEEIDSAAHDVCATAYSAFTDAGCLGVGMTLEQRFTVYITTFFHETPPEFDAHTAIPDA